MSYSGQLYFPCKQSQFTLVQDTTHNTGTWTDTQYGVKLHKSSNGNATGLIAMLQSCPSTPYSAIAHMVWSGTSGNGLNTSYGDPGPGEYNMGLCITNGTSTSSGLKQILSGALNGSNSANVSGGGTIPVNLWGVTAPYRYSNFTSPASGGTFYQHNAANFSGNSVWFKVHDDGINLTYYVGSDGVLWQSLATEGRTNNFTATNVGVCSNPYGGDADFTLVSFQCATNL